MIAVETGFQIKCGPLRVGIDQDLNGIPGIDDHDGSSRNLHPEGDEDEGTGRTKLFHLKPPALSKWDFRAPACATLRRYVLFRSTRRIAAAGASAESFP